MKNKKIVRYHGIKNNLCCKCKALNKSMILVDELKRFGQYVKCVTPRKAYCNKCYKLYLAKIKAQGHELEKYN